MKVRTGKNAAVSKNGRSGGGLQIPEVINKSVSSRTPKMIWVRLFLLPPEVYQGHTQKMAPDKSLPLLQ